MKSGLLQIRIRQVKLKAFVLCQIPVKLWDWAMISVQNGMILVTRVRGPIMNVFILLLMASVLTLINLVHPVVSKLIAHFPYLHTTLMY